MWSLKSLYPPLTNSNSHLKILPIHPRFASYLYEGSIAQKHASRPIILLSAHFVWIPSRGLYLFVTSIRSSVQNYPAIVCVCVCEWCKCKSGCRICLLFIRIPKSAIVKGKKCNIKESLCDDWNGHNCEVVMATRNIVFVC